MKLAKKKRIIHGEYQWALSYVDTLSLLLCFFIISFSFKKGKSDSNLDSIKTLFSTINNDSKVKDKESTESANNSENFDLARIAKVVKDKKKVMITFDHVSFFDLGKTAPNKQGLKVINQIIELLAPYKESVVVTVYGHTDTFQVVNSKRKFSDNWELSVLRATSVLKLFMSKGFSSKRMFAAGRPSFKSSDKYVRTIASESSKRKVTFVIRENSDV